MKKTIKILIIIIAIILFLLMAFILKSTFSRYFSNIDGEASQDVASPIFVLDKGEKKVLNDENTEVEYTFAIKNFNSENLRTETDLKYTIKIDANTDSSITYELYKEDGTKVNLDNNLKSEEIEIGHKKDITQNYRLVVKYDRENTNATADINEKIYIKAYAVQG